MNKVLVRGRAVQGDERMLTPSKIAPCLWFDSQAEEAAKHYASIFPRSGIDSISHYGREGSEVHHRPAGSVMTVTFHLWGQSFTALNGGPLFTFSEAISLQVSCDTQDEIDHYWSKLCDGGQEGPCGWLKDKFGVSWQVVPAAMAKMMTAPDPRRSERVTRAFLKMKKLDLAVLERAFAGKQ